MTDYGFEHNGTVHTPNGSAVSSAENASRNEAIRLAELEHWTGQPDRMQAYYSFTHEPKVYQSAFYPLAYGYGQDCKVTTWLGDRLGQIISAHVYLHNFGGRFVALRVKATNGAEYYGRASYDWGSCVTLHRVARSSMD